AFDVVEAQDGLDALQKMREVGNVALVVCDANMPRMGGMEFLEHVRNDEKLRSTPVVMLTTEVEPGLVQRAKSLGAKGWIIKPFRADLLISAATKLAGAQVSP